jgi:hypothetical protein
LEKARVCHMIKDLAGAPRYLVDLYSEGGFGTADSLRNGVEISPTGHHGEPASGMGELVKKGALGDDPVLVFQRKRRRL